ncbi:MAG: TusE/DsrC/DsvC family sulfur relay protein [candidate division Zixibacteria bacterium]|nr:TusE/DsrC/DsvC family sulfur relay protein [Candidatus Tariuqbacter arcticus]
MDHLPPKTLNFGEDKTYNLDEYGFLDPPEQWDVNFANGMARLQGIYDGLTKEHWDFIHYIREKFLKENDLPLLVIACADNKLRLNKLSSLFPTGYFRGACRIAGINYKFMCDINIWHTYETKPSFKREFKVTLQGFLEDFNMWTERFAHLVSAEWELPRGLTTKHWEVIYFLRNCYLITNNIPSVFEVCKANNLDIEDLKELFPGGYRRGACRIAGLPYFS